MKSAPTLPDPSVPMTSVRLASLLGLSQSTVSLAIADSPRIKAATRALVQQAARLHGYAPNRVARAMRLGQSNILGIIVPSFHVSFFTDFIDTIEVTAKKLGYQCLICQSHSDPEIFERDLMLLRDQQVDGLILTTQFSTMCNPTLSAMIRDGKPIVFVSSPKSRLPVGQMQCDDSGNGRIAAEHLISLGHKKIALLAGYQSEQAQNHVNGFRAALESHGLTLDDRLIAGHTYEFDGGIKGMQQILKTRLKFTAVATATDLTAVAAVQALHAAGLSVPGDVSVVGCANLDLAKWMPVPLTSVDVDIAEMARLTTSHLVTSIEQRTSLPTIVMPGRIVVRQSTAPPKKLR